jgi:hypothetical protein
MFCLAQKGAEFDNWMTSYLKNKYTPTALPLSDQKKCGHVRKIVVSLRTEYDTDFLSFQIWILLNLT